MFTGNVIRSESLEPNYKVTFTYINDKYNIVDGCAIFKRQSPYPKVTFDDFTDYMLEKQEVDEHTVKFIRLQLGKVVFDYLMDTR